MEFTGQAGTRTRFSQNLTSRPALPPLPLGAGRRLWSSRDREQSLQLTPLRATPVSCWDRIKRLQSFLKLSCFLGHNLTLCYPSQVTGRYNLPSPVLPGPPASLGALEFNPQRSIKRVARHSSLHVNVQSLSDPDSDNLNANSTLSCWVGRRLLWAVIRRRGAADSEPQEALCKCSPGGSAAAP